MSNRIAYMRDKRGLSQEQLANLVGTTQATIWKYEHEVTEPRAGILSRMAKVFDCSMEYLLGVRDEDEELSDWDERELVRIFRMLNRRDQRILTTIAEVFEDEAPYRE